MESEERNDPQQSSGSTPPTWSEVKERWAQAVEDAPTFQEALGDRLRALREAERRTTTDVADLARYIGLPWHRTTVGNIERGKRALTAGELLTLPLLYDKPLAELLPRNVMWFTDTLAGSRAALWTAIVGDENGRVGGSGTGRWHVEGAPTADELTESFLQAWLNHTAKFPPGREDAPVRAVLATPDETDKKAAAKLETTPEYISYAAQTTYGRSLAEEREARLAEHEDQPNTKRGLQAVRGHITRRLLEELAPTIASYCRTEQEGND